jgi:mRNA-degrading endonuclease RelE of RelBE toxin-antitoxin system
MNYKFHSEARREVISATKHYQNIYTRLGKDFRNEIEETISRILANPKAWHPFKKKYRRCLLKKFPFGIIYKVDENKDICLIFAVMHLHRNPGYWKDRKF